MYGSLTESRRAPLIHTRFERIAGVRLKGIALLKEVMGTNCCFEDSNQQYIICFLLYILILIFLAFILKED